MGLYIIFFSLKNLVMMNTLALHAKIPPVKEKQKQILCFSLKTEVVKLRPTGQIWPIACFINKVLLEPIPTYLFVNFLWVL